MQDRLETYLDEVRTQLSALPAPKRDEEMEELRQHLLTLVAAGQARGLSGDDAVAAAIAQFGGAGKVGRELRHAVLAPRDSGPRIAMAGFCTLILNIFGAAAYLATWILLDIHTSLPDSALYENGPTTDWLSVTCRLVARSYTLLALPFLAGWMGSAIAPRRAVWGIVPVYLTLALALSLGHPEWGWHLTLLVQLPIVLWGALMRAWRTRRRERRTAA